MCEARGAPLVRINPRAPQVASGNGVGVRLGAREALLALRALLE
jgi:hypothetical protein